MVWLIAGLGLGKCDYSGMNTKSPVHRLMFGAFGLFERAGRKQRLDGDLADGEEAIRAIGALVCTARDKLTLFKRL